MAYSKKISIFVDAMTSGARRKLRGMETSFSRLRRTGTQATSTLASRTKDFASSIFSLEGIARVALAGVGVHYAQMAIQASSAMARIAAKNLDLQASFETLTQRHKLASDELIDAVSKAAKGTVDKFSLMLEINKALRLGVADTVDDFVALMKIAVVRAKEFGITTQQSWGYLITAIGRASPMIADNIGILLDANATYEEYARTIGKSADELTKLEQKEAIRNRILREGIPDMETWNQMGETAATKFQQLDARLIELKQTIGELLLPDIIEMTEWLGKAADAADRLFKSDKFLEFQIIKTSESTDELGRRLSELYKGRQAENIFLQQIIDRYERGQGVLDKYTNAYVESAAAIRRHNAAQLLAGDVTEDTSRDIEELSKQLKKASDIWGDYNRAVARQNEQFARRVADAQFRATQAAENAAFRRGEILRRAEESRADAIRDFQHNLRRETERHHLELQRMTQDHFDCMADLEYDHEKERSELMRRAPWWIRNALKKEFSERERIAKTGDKKALSAFDKALLERIRAIDPAYAKELDLLLEKHEHETKIEQREADKSRTRRQEDWNIQRRELDYQMQSRLQDIERDLQNQLNAWRFADQQRRENERRAMENLRTDHNRALRDLRDDAARRLADFNELWAHWGRKHGETYMEALQRALSAPVSFPGSPGLPGPQWTPSQWSWTPAQGGMPEVPRTMGVVVHRGEAILPAPEAAAWREGGLTIIVENINLAGVGTAMDAKNFGQQIAESLGESLRERKR